MRPGFVPRSPLASLPLAALFVAAPVMAEPSASDKASAERLFNSARRLSVAANHAEACPLYAESQRFEPAVGTLMYLADCYEKTGKPASAWATWLEAVAAARRDGQKDREKTASERAAAAEKRVPNLSIEVPGSSRLPGLVVSKNGEPIKAALFGTPLPTDPGTFLIEATAPGHKPWKQSVEVVAEGTKILVVPELQPLPVEASPPTALSSAPPSAVPPPATPPPEPPGNSRKTVAFVVGGVGVASLAIGSFFGLRALSRNDASKDECRTATLCNQTGLDLRDEARFSGNLSTLFFALGAVGVGAGATLLLTTPSQNTAALRLNVAGPRDGHLSLVRSF
jgi:hypothetical protein